MSTDRTQRLLQPQDVTLPSGEDPAVALVDDALSRRVRAMVTPALVEEHRRSPFGPHGNDLAMLLSYFRSRPVEGKLAILSLGAMGPYRIVRLAGRRGVAPEWLSDETYDQLGDAEHAVFLRRVEALGCEASS